MKYAFFLTLISLSSTIFCADGDQGPSRFRASEASQSSDSVATGGGRYVHDVPGPVIDTLTMHFRTHTETGEPITKEESDTKFYQACSLDIKRTKREIALLYLCAALTVTPKDMLYAEDPIEAKELGIDPKTTTQEIILLNFINKYKPRSIYACIKPDITTILLDKYSEKMQLGMQKGCYRNCIHVEFGKADREDNHRYRSFINPKSNMMNPIELLEYAKSQNLTEPATLIAAFITPTKGNPELGIRTQLELFKRFLNFPDYEPIINATLDKGAVMITIKPVKPEASAEKTTDNSTPSAAGAPSTALEGAILPL